MTAELLPAAMQQAPLGCGEDYVEGNFEDCAPYLEAMVITLEERIDEFDSAQGQCPECQQEFQVWDNARAQAYQDAAFAHALCSMATAMTYSWCLEKTQVSDLSAATARAKKALYQLCVQIFCSGGQYAVVAPGLIPVPRPAEFVNYLNQRGSRFANVGIV